MNTINGKTWSKLLWSFAEEMARWEENMLALLIEMVPGLSTWLLPDWERNLGLPDECSPLAPTVEQRQQIAHAKYTAKYSGLSAAFYTDLAEQYGSTVVVIDSPGGKPFRVNKNRVDRTQPDGINGSRLNSLGALHTFKVVIDSTDPNKETIECIFNKLKPAHTSMIWSET